MALFSQVPDCAGVPKAPAVVPPTKAPAKTPRAAGKTPRAAGKTPRTAGKTSRTAGKSRKAAGAAPQKPAVTGWAHVPAPSFHRSPPRSGLEEYIQQCLPSEALELPRTEFNLYDRAHGVRTHLGRWNCKRSRVTLTAVRRLSLARLYARRRRQCKRAQSVQA